MSFENLASKQKNNARAAADALDAYGKKIQQTNNNILLDSIMPGHIETALERISATALELGSFISMNIDSNKIQPLSRYGYGFSVNIGQGFLETCKLAFHRSANYGFSGFFDDYETSIISKIKEIKDEAKKLPRSILIVALFSDITQSIMDKIIEDGISGEINIMLHSGDFNLMKAALSSYPEKFVFAEDTIESRVELNNVIKGFDTWHGDKKFNTVNLLGEHNLPIVFQEPIAGMLASHEF